MARGNSGCGTGLRHYGGHTLGPARAEHPARYGGATIEAQEAVRAAHQAARSAALRAELVTGRTLRMPLQRFKISFNPSTLTHLGRYGSVYHRVMLSAPWGRITGSHGDALIDAKFTALTVAAPASVAGRTLQGRGWVLKLAPGERAP